MTHDERLAALEEVASDVRSCTRCRLHETRTRAVPGEGNADTEVVFVGEGPGQNEDRQGRPFVGRAGDLLVKFLATLRWGPLIVPCPRMLAAIPPRFVPMRTGGLEAVRTRFPPRFVIPRPRLTYNPVR